MNSRCSDVLLTDRWNISKIKTMLSTNKIPSFNYQSSQAFFFFFFFESLQVLYRLYFITLQGEHNMGQILSY